jgi:methylenetetrahydrofolate reductase (NADPH)
MLRVFQNDLQDPKRFVITLELVPGREASGRAVDIVMGIARDAFGDGRVSAVSITDNPGGNPSLSPDVLGHQIFRIGMDVIVHFTCRDANRVGMESRALQLAMMGMKNILALTGDYTGSGFAGQGAPVFDLDSVSLLAMLAMLSDRLEAGGDPDGFFAGCAASPFKATAGESAAQYAKLCRKRAAGAQFVISQLGYDADRFYQMVRASRAMGLDLPLLGSVYVLTPRAARIMNAGQVPGAVVPDRLRDHVCREWTDRTEGRRAAVERSARLAAVLKGLGFRGIHIGGIHRDFSLVARILDRLAQIENRWPEFLSQFDGPDPARIADEDTGNAHPCVLGAPTPALDPLEKLHFHFMRMAHAAFFRHEGAAANLWRAVSRRLDGHGAGRLLARTLEDPVKGLLLDCRHCGDCAIQHLAFLCPESQCPKHTRNGACGGSRNGRCEVHPERECVWFRAWRRWAAAGQTERLAEGCVPPRLWSLNETSSWLNFHLDRDHQGSGAAFMRYCRSRQCRLAGPPPAALAGHRRAAD